ncbi:hypothetical protein BJ138DRAFT_1099552 [Hygrophoropsis aurantiaca]|uniref:Uncharacterized protein n=1 Tax=Hygrophoropsis aurantiaca TaxID=72124 RepID=A0ACB8AIL9_9AGAM|nr:hypothetical protein BJ138DRAFT_1099552 [Hygrophoropsis aurantiaca]
MQSNIEQAFSDLIISEIPITIEGLFLAYVRAAGFTEPCQEAATSFEHALDKYPSRPPKSHAVSDKKLRELMISYWTQKLGTLVIKATIRPCPCCQEQVLVTQAIVDELQYPGVKRPLNKARKARRTRVRRDVRSPTTVVDPYAPSTSTFVL